MRLEKLILTVDENHKNELLKILQSIRFIHVEDESDILDKFMMRIIIDVNLWISFAIGKRLSNLEMILKNRNIQIFHTEMLLNEITEVIQRPKLKKYVSIERQQELLELILTHSQSVSIKDSEIQNLSRDSKDNYLLALCQQVNADFLLTGDHDLLVLKRMGRTQILLFSDFMEKLVT